jgi:uncharacterized membrane protein
MTPKQISVLLGGVLPAFLLGLAGIFQKLASSAELGTGPFLIIAGAATAAVGGAFTLIERDAGWTLRTAGLTCLFALMWATATGCISIALRRFEGQMSQLVPLYNMNTLIAVLAGAVLLSEWKTVNPGRVTLAAILIIIGGALAAKS